MFHVAGFDLLSLWYLDIDECLVAALNATDLCEGVENSQCVNTEGSYDCVCVPGYTLVNGSCERELATYMIFIVTVLLLKVLCLIRYCE